MHYAPIARGKVVSVSINGVPQEELHLTTEGIVTEKHYGYERQLSGHDGGYIRTSNLKKGDTVFNWRSWTALSAEELREIEQELGVPIPQGCLLENIVVEGIPNFSKLPPTSRLVFPSEPFGQAILAVWEENTPCKKVGKRLEDHHGIDGLFSRFVQAAEGKRGVTGLVLSRGYIHIGNEVLVYLPVAH